MAKVRTAAKRRTGVRRLRPSAILQGGEHSCWGYQKGFYIMKNKAVKIGIIASILPHLFCCVLPIVLSVVGLFAPEFAHSEIVPHWVEPWLFVFSGLMLCVSWYLVLRDCKCECEHCHDGHGHSHRTQKIIIAVITVIFIISLILHFVAHH